MACPVLLAAALGLAGCMGGGDQDGSARDGGSIGVGVSALPKTLDPALATEPDELQLLWLVHTPLLTYRRANGREGTQLVARPGPRPAEGLRGRPDLPALRCARGSPTRTARPCARATSSARSTGCALHSPLARALRRDRHDRGQRQDRRDRDHAGAAGPVVPVRARAALERPGAARHTAARPDRGRPRASGPTGSCDPRRACPCSGRAASSCPACARAHRPDHHLRPAAAAPSRSRRSSRARLDVMQEPAPVDLLPEMRSKYRDRYREDTTASTRRGRARHGRCRRSTTRGAARHRGVARPADAHAALRRPARAELQPGAGMRARLPPARPCPIGRPRRAARPAEGEAGDRRRRRGRLARDVVADPGVPRAVERNVVGTLRKIGLAASTRPGAATLRGAALRAARRAPGGVRRAGRRQRLRPRPAGGDRRGDARPSRPSRATTPGPPPTGSSSRRATRRP